MGQGLHTKVAQVVAHDLGIPLQDVYIAETATGGSPPPSGWQRASTRCTAQPLCGPRRRLSTCYSPVPHVPRTPLPALLAPSTPLHPASLPLPPTADKVPNASPTAASASSDMYGAAAADACAQLNGRLKPYYEKMPGKGFKARARNAHGAPRRQR